MSYHVIDNSTKYWGLPYKVYVLISFLHGYLGCPFGIKPKKKCRSNVCDSSVCTTYPDAVCFLDECSDCSPRYLMGNSDVTEFCCKTYVTSSNVFWNKEKMIYRYCTAHSSLQWYSSSLACSL